MARSFAGGARGPRPHPRPPLRRPELPARHRPGDLNNGRTSHVTTAGSTTEPASGSSASRRRSPNPTILGGRSSSSARKWRSRTAISSSLAASPPPSTRFNDPSGRRRGNRADRRAGPDEVETGAVRERHDHRHQSHRPRRLVPHPDRGHPENWYKIVLPDGSMGPPTQVQLFNTPSHATPSPDAVAKLRLLYQPPRTPSHGRACTN